MTTRSVLIAEGRALLEAGKYDPFKRKAHLGPGPRSGENDKAKKRWKCKCSNYSCMCKRGKATKQVNIDPSYKKDYNADYYDWRFAGGGE